MRMPDDRWDTVCVYSETLICGKLGSACVHHVLYNVCQDQSTLIFYVLSFSELNDCKILQDSFRILLRLIMLRTTLLSHTRNDRNVNMLTRALQKWLVIQNCIFIQHSTVTTHLT
jgi:hypothetical protein